MQTGDQRLRILQVMNRLDGSEVARYVLSVSNEMDRNRFAIFRSLTLLRQLSLAPVLIDEKVQLIADDYKELLGAERPENAEYVLAVESPSASPSCVAS